MKCHYQIILSDSIRYTITGLLLVAYPYKIPYIISSLMLPFKKIELLTITSLIVLAAAITPLIISTNFEGRSVIMQISYAQQQNVMNQTSSGFHSVFNTFVVPGSSHGYGVYEEHKSNVFKPGEKIALYIEPVGFTHRPITGT